MEAAITRSRSLASEGKKILSEIEKTKNEKKCFTIYDLNVERNRNAKNVHNEIEHPIEKDKN